MTQREGATTGLAVPSASAGTSSRPSSSMKRPVVALLAGLEHEQHSSGQVVAVRLQQAGGAGEHRHVQVGAGVHHVVGGAGELGARVLVHWQCVHVAAQQDRRPGPPSVEHGGHPARALVQRDVEPEVVDRLEHALSCEAGRFRSRGADARRGAGALRREGGPAPRPAGRSWPWGMVGTPPAGRRGRSRAQVPFVQVLVGCPLWMHGTALLAGRRWWPPCAPSCSRRPVAPPRRPVPLEGPVGNEADRERHRFRATNALLQMIYGPIGSLLEVGCGEDTTVPPCCGVRRPDGSRCLRPRHPPCRRGCLVRRSSPARSPPSRGGPRPDASMSSSPARCCTTAGSRPGCSPTWSTSAGRGVFVTCYAEGMDLVRDAVVSRRACTGRIPLRRHGAGSGVVACAPAMMRW